MKKLVKVAIVVMVVLLLAGCAGSPNNKPILNVEDRTVALGETLTIDLKTLVVDESKDTLVYEITGVGELNGSTYTFTPAKEDAYDEKTVTIKVKDNLSQEANCTFKITPNIVLKGKILFEGVPVNSYNQSNATAEITLGSAPQDQCAFEYNSSNSDYTFNNVPLGLIEVQVNVPPFGKTNVSLPGGIAYTRIIDLNATPIASYSEINIDDGVYSIHISDPINLENGDVDPSSIADPYPSLSGSFWINWEDVPGAANYEIIITRYENGMGTGAPWQTINESQFYFTGFTSTPDYYEFNIKAMDTEGNEIGKLYRIYIDGKMDGTRFQYQQ